MSQAYLNRIRHQGMSFSWRCIHRYAPKHQRQLQKSTVTGYVKPMTSRSPISHQTFKDSSVQNIPKKSAALCPFCIAKGSQGSSRWKALSQLIIFRLPQKGRASARCAATPGFQTTPKAHTVGLAQNGYGRPT